EDYPVQQIDLVPTVLAMCGFSQNPAFQGIDVLSTNRPALKERDLYLHSGSGVTLQDVIISQGRFKFVHDLLKKQSALYDLSTDPGENENLVTKLPIESIELERKLTKWRSHQLAYYHYPTYYLQYYAPPIE